LARYLRIMTQIYLHSDLPQRSEIRANTRNQKTNDVRTLVEHFLVPARRRWRVRVPRRRIVVVILGMAALVVPLDHHQPPSYIGFFSFSFFFFSFFLLLLLRPIVIFCFRRLTTRASLGKHACLTYFITISVMLPKLNSTRRFSANSKPSFPPAYVKSLSPGNHFVTVTSTSPLIKKVTTLSQFHCIVLEFSFSFI